MENRSLVLLFFISLTYFYNDVMPISIKIDPIFPEKDVLSKRGAAILKGLENVVSGDIANQLESAMEKRVANWKHKPGFKKDFNSLPTRLSLLVTPAGANKGKWVMVSGGVPGHFIFPKNYRKSMLFIHGGRGGYSPKTRPGNYYGGPGSYSNNSYWAFVVHHPGIVARKFEENVALEETPKIISKIEGVINRLSK